MPPPSSPALTLETCDHDTREFLLAPTGGQSVDRDFYFGLPKEIQLEMVREWRHERRRKKQKKATLMNFFGSAAAPASRA